MKNGGFRDKKVVSELREKLESLITNAFLSHFVRVDQEIILGSTILFQLSVKSEVNFTRLFFLFIPIISFTKQFSFYFSDKFQRVFQRKNTIERFHRQKCNKSIVHRIEGYYVSRGRVQKETSVVESIYTKWRHGTRHLSDILRPLQEILLSFPALLCNSSPLCPLLPHHRQNSPYGQKGRFSSTRAIFFCHLPKWTFFLYPSMIPSSLTKLDLATATFFLPIRIASLSFIGVIRYKSLGRRKRKKQEQSWIGEKGK